MYLIYKINLPRGNFQERKSSRGHRYFYKSHAQRRLHKNQVFPTSEHFSPFGSAFGMFHYVQPFRATRHATRIARKKKVA